MLKIVIPEYKNFWREDIEEFVNFEGVTLELEHSLYTVKEWEGIHHKPFIGNKEKTNEELLSYIKCMTMNDVSDEAYDYLTLEDLENIQNYIDDDQTATTIGKDLRDPDKEGASKTEKNFVSAEILYYYMFSYRIPLELEHWHLGRLIMLINVFNEKAKEEEQSAKNKGKRGKSRLNAKQQATLAQRYHDINERNKAYFKTKG